MPETVGAAENVILGVLLDKGGEVIYPLTIAEQVADALRDAGLLLDPPSENATDTTGEPGPTAPPS